MTRKRPFTSTGLTIVIPAYNEEECLEEVFREIRAHAIELVGRLEMVLVDDGSTDGTGELVDRLARRHPDTLALHHLRNQGSGQAILTGIRASTLPLIVYLPADGQFHLPDLADYIRASRHSQIVMGARSARTDYTLFRRLSSRVFLGLFNLLFRKRFEDVNWVHLWRREVFLGLHVESRGVFFLAEVLAKSCSLGMNAVQVPSGYSGRRAGVANGTRLPVILLTVYEMARIWWRMNRSAPSVESSVPGSCPGSVKGFWWPATARESGSIHAGGGQIGESRPPRLEVLEVSPQLRPNWLPREGRLAVTPGVALSGPPADSEVLARIDGRPAVVRDHGQIRFLFDPERAVSWRLTEAFLDGARPLVTRLPAGYTDWLPGPVRHGLHRLFIAAGRPDDPADFWPFDPSVEWIRWAALEAEAEGGNDRVPDPFWPDRKRWALVVTHDVDTVLGMGRIQAIADVEKSRGLRSCWYVTGEAGLARPDLLDAVAARGDEIGLHGDRHDLGLAYLKADEIEARLGGCLDRMEAWKIRGYRSPALLVSPALSGVVARHFQYDSSVPDTDTASLLGSRRGCGTLFPFRRPEGSIELPLTLPLEDKLAAMGHSPREILGIWRNKIETIRRIGGLAVLTTHAEPHLGGSDRFLEVYGEFLDSVTGADDVWLPLPHQAASWWERRCDGERMIKP